MRAVTFDRFHRRTAWLESSIWSAFISAGSLLLTIITIIVLFFGVFVLRSQ